MMYTASVIDKRSGADVYIDGDFSNRKEFEIKLHSMDYLVYQIEPKEVFDFMLRGIVNWTPDNWRKARLLHKQGVIITKEAMEAIK